MSGIAKPVRRAFELLHKYAGKQFLPVHLTLENGTVVAGDTGEYLSVFATPDPAGGAGSGVTVFLSTWDLRSAGNNKVVYANDTGCPHAQPDGCLRHITVSLPAKLGGIIRSADGSASAELHRIDSKSSNPRELWERMGSPVGDLSRAQLSALQSASVVPMEMLQTAERGTLQFEFTMPPNAAWVLRCGP